MTKKRVSFAGDVLKLVSGTTFAQLLGIVTMPLLARLYAPEAFGVLLLFTSITGILGVIACMRYELSIMLPESDEEAVNLLGVSLIFTFLISLGTVLLVWWGRESLLYRINATSLALYIWMVPVLVFIHGVFLAFNHWNSRKRHFKLLSIATMTASAATATIGLGGGYAGYATGGTLIGATVAGQAIAVTVLGGQTWREHRKLFFRAVRWKKMLAGLKRYRKFPLYATWSVLLNTASWQMPVFLLFAFFSTTVVGYYSLGFRILYVPMSLIGNAIAQVFFQRAAAARVEGTLAFLVENAFKRLVMIGLFPMLMLTVIGRDLCIVFFGSNWAEAGVYTQILSLWAFFWFISSPLSLLFSVLEKQELGLKINIVLFITRFASLGIGGYLSDVRLALFLFAVSGIAVYGYLSLIIMASSGVSWRTTMNIIVKRFLRILPFVVIQITVNIVCYDTWIKLFSACILSTFYLLFLFKTEPNEFKAIRFVN